MVVRRYTMSVIKPISFIDNEIVASEDLNNIFVTPHRLRMISDVGKNDLLDDLRKDLSQESYQEFTKQYGELMMRNRDAIINNYIEMNVLDLYTSSINWLRATYFKSFELPSMIVSGGKKMLPEFSFNTNYMTQILVPFTEEAMVNALSIYIEEYMDVSIGIITSLYNNWITDDINQIKDSDLIDVLYSELYMLTYGEEPTKTISDYMKYTFCLTTCREIVEMQLVKIRQGMVCISGNVVAMVLEQYGFNNHIADQSFSTKQLLDKGCYEYLGVKE